MAGEPSAAVTAASALPRLEELSTEPPAGPTVMSRTHADAMRKGVARLKSHLKDPEEAEAFLRVLVLGYLGEWSAMYALGSREAGSATERTILMIRQDTVQQMVAELGRTPG